MLRNPHARRLVRLVRARLRTANAWAVAARLAEDFAGPLTTLISTADAATADASTMDASTTGRATGGPSTAGAGAPA
ncbi:hypothetical protein OG216_01075 [Streptomycetaceae bacterium NBC_01309]